jgi:hypothetical protein
MCEGNTGPGVVLENCAWHTLNPAAANTVMLLKLNFMIINTFLSPRQVSRAMASGGRPRRPLGCLLDYLIHKFAPKRPGCYMGNFTGHGPEGGRGRWKGYGTGELRDGEGILRILLPALTLESKQLVSLGFSKHGPESWLTRHGDLTFLANPSEHKSCSAEWLVKNSAVKPSQPTYRRFGIWRYQR